MYWIFFVTMAGLLVSGGALYFGFYSGYDVAMLHWVGTWVILAFVVLHVLTQFKSGGVSQLLRIFRPAGLPAPPQRLDAAELLGMLAEQSARRAESGNVDAPPEVSSHPLQPGTEARRDRTGQPDPAPRSKAGPARSRNPTLQANAFVVAAAAAITGGSLLVATDRMSVDSVQVRRISPADAPILDGDTSDRAWRDVKSFSLLTGEGGNFDGKGEARIEVRAVHDGTYAYFLFTWQDLDALAETATTRQGSRWMAPAAFRLSARRRASIQRRQVFGAPHHLRRDAGRRPDLSSRPQSVAGAPATMSGRGLHYTETGYADVWQWKATSGATGWMDDAHFGPPLNPTPMQARQRRAVQRRLRARPGHGRLPGQFRHRSRHVRRSAPQPPGRSAAAAQSGRCHHRRALGDIDLDPNHGESDGARWSMTEQESVPYSTDADARIPMGTVIPGVITGR